MDKTVPRNTSVSLIALRSLPLFHDLPDTVLMEVARVSSMRRYERGQAVVQAGDMPDGVYFILTGNLKVVVNDQEGREVIFSFLGQGELFGEMALFNDHVRSASVVATSAVDLVVIGKRDFRQLSEAHFEIVWRLMGSLAGRLRQADRKIESLALMDVYGRVARLLLEMADDVGGQKIVVRKMAKQDIAKMVGASREMVSRVMKDLSSRGLIEETDAGIILREHLADLQ